MNGTESDLVYLCKKVQEIARASATFLEEERRKFNWDLVEGKSAHSCVSYVDKGSERQAIGALSTLLPEVGFITEGGSGGLIDEEYCWVTDLLDGASNYIHDIAPHCVSVALRNRRELLLGVVYEVRRDGCFYAAKDGRAYLDRNKVHVPDVSVLDKAFTTLGFPYSFDAYRPIAGYLVDRLYGFAGGTHLMGSAAAELCYTVVKRFNARVGVFLDPWDVAAGALIPLQAGGKVSDLNRGENWAPGEQAVASNGEVHSLVLSLLP